jgi:predicted DNA-binding protein (MmcQ/YjbR family)
VVVKCDPDIAIALRDRYEEISEAWHFNKRHWNAIRLNGDLSQRLILRQIYNSYMLVIRKNVTPAALRREVISVVENMDISELNIGQSDLEDI